jgi:hypothetical protein
LSETPQTTAYPGEGAVSAASTSATVSVGESQVARWRTVVGWGKALPIRRQTTSMPCRSAYSEPSASIATLETP